MRIIAAGVLAAVLAACASTPEQQGPVYSWGKAGVGLEEYWIDSAECAARGAQADSNLPVATHSMDRQGGPIGEQNRNIAADESIIGLNDSILRARQNEMMQIRADEAVRQEVLDACLTERGYRVFQLTAAQAAQLSTLRNGSVQRRRFLHRLGSDPAVLEAQSL